VNYDSRVTSHPLVSVITPTYNREPYLREAVASVIAQTYEHWELLVVDDGSTDGTREFLDSIGDARVRPIFRPHEGNPAVLRNGGAAAARGSYIAFLDSDDYWLPRKLELQVEDLLAHPECRWSYVARDCVDERGQPLDVPGLRRWVPYTGWILEHVVASRALVATSATMVERRLFDAVAQFNPALRRCQDVELWIKLAEASPVTVVPTVLVKKRVYRHDRGTNLLDVQAYMNRIYGELSARTTSASVRRLCRRRRAQVNLDIAGGLRGAGRYAEARRALWTAFSHAAWHPPWWTALLKTVLRPALPAGLLSLYALARGRRLRRSG
jgi:glycosyltransferase involved in cell wall biosynthesis